AGVGARLLAEWSGVWVARVGRRLCLRRRGCVEGKVRRVAAGIEVRTGRVVATTWLRRGGPVLFLVRRGCNGGRRSGASRREDTRRDERLGAPRDQPFARDSPDQP